MDFISLDYLTYGTERQQRVYCLLTDHAIMERLAEFDPVLAGTVPLNIDIASSDLDIICMWMDADLFRNAVVDNFSLYDGFSIEEKIVRDRQTVIAHFRIDGFAVEIFGQNRPVMEQEAFRHMVIEYHVLQDKGEVFRQQVIELKQQGVKTEPAFAKLLGLPGKDPYMELLSFSVPDKFSDATFSLE